MSLHEFQRALTDFVASPDRCRAALATPCTLDDEYDLTERELNRLVHSAKQPGMRVCWSLHRANRFGPMHAILPLTCRALGQRLRGELDAFWTGALPEDLQFKSEAERFVSFLRRRVREGELSLPVLDDLASFELAMAELRFMPQRQIRDTLLRAASMTGRTVLVLHPFVRLLHFEHDPEELLDTLIREGALPPDLARGDFHVLVDGKEGGMAIRLLDARLARILDTFRIGIPASLDMEEVKSLLNAGLVARWPLNQE